MLIQSSTLNCFKLVLLSLELHKYMYYYFIPTPVDIVNGVQVYKYCFDEVDALCLVWVVVGS